MRGCTRLECYTIPCTHSSPSRRWYPAAVFPRAGQLGMFPGSTSPRACALSSSPEPRVVRRPVSSQQVKTQRRAASVGQWLIYQHFLRRHRTGFLRGQLERLRARQGVRKDLGFLLVVMASLGPYWFGRLGRCSYSLPQESTCSDTRKQVDSLHGMLKA